MEKSLIDKRGLGVMIHKSLLLQMIRFIAVFFSLENIGFSSVFQVVKCGRADILRAATAKAVYEGLASVSTFFKSDSFQPQMRNQYCLKLSFTIC